MILIGLGANLPAPDGALPKKNLLKALEILKEKGVAIKAVSPFYKSAPVPYSDQPWFINAVARVETPLSAGEFLEILHHVEEKMGRTRRVKNEARIIDLDLLDYNDQVIEAKEGGLVLPHPRMHLRHFVLQPLAALAPQWRHPTLGKSATDLLENLPYEGTAELYIT